MWLLTISKSFIPYLLLKAFFSFYHTIKKPFRQERTVKNRGENGQRTACPHFFVRFSRSVAKSAPTPGGATGCGKKTEKAGLFLSFPVVLRDRLGLDRGGNFVVVSKHSPPEENEKFLFGHRKKRKCRLSFLPAETGGFRVPGRIKISSSECRAASSIKEKEKIGNGKEEKK